jgi:DNA topoisomerase-1
MLAGPDGSQRHMLRANGSTLVKPGFMSVYQEGADDVKTDDDDHVLPAMNEGDKVALAAFKAEQHFTEPPPRYSEASLVKALEEYGIGRPSTYATIISTLQDREYVEMDNRRFIPTDIGKIVGRFLGQYFTRYVANDFTAALEDELDAVSRGEEEWTMPLSKFWKPFIQEVEKVEKNVSREQVAMARDIGTHPESGKPMSVRMGRYGPFVQIGTKDDEEKPKFAGLRPGQKMDNITLEQALELFKLPRTLGATADGEPVMTNVGRFGPYIKYGAKYVSLKEDDPYTVELPRALELIRLKQEADANRIIASFESDGIQVLNGRYGPYVTNGKKNAKIPKDRDPKSITLEEAKVMIEQAPERGTGRFGRGKRPGAPAKKAAATTDAKSAAKGSTKRAKGGAATSAGNGAAQAAKSADAGSAGAASAKSAGSAGTGGAGSAGKADKKASAKAPAAAKKTAASNTPAQRAAGSAKAGKSSGGPVPKGVSNVVRKGQSAAARAHARKTAARGGVTGGSAGKATSAKPGAKRARSE